MRIVRTVLRSWKKYKKHPDPRIRARFAHDASNLPVRYAGVLWACRRHYRDDPRQAGRIDELLSELYEECGWLSRLAAPIVGRYLYRKLRRQDEMLQDNWTYEPPVFYETNYRDESKGAAPAKSALASSSAGSTNHTTEDAKSAETVACS